MRKKIMRLVCAGMASCCVLMAAGQEKAAEVRIIDRYDLSESRSELRADNVEWWPDSVIRYNYLGEPFVKLYYNKENRTYTYASLENGSWDLDGPYSSSGYSFVAGKVAFIEEFEEDDGYWILVCSILYASHIQYSKETYSYNTVYDDKNNLILVEFTDKESSKVTHTYRMKYNEDNQIVWTDYYYLNDLAERYSFEYNKNGDQISCKHYDYDNYYGEDSYSMERVKYDEQGRPVESYISHSSSRYYFIPPNYNIYYYSDATYTPDIKLENNTPIGSDNQGSFDLNVNIPTDSISSGSVTVTFPEGFTLDEENTSLTLDFAADFTLTITKQENNSWLLEIKPKALRSAPLRADEVQKAIQIAYQVDEEAKRGSYDISVNSILFTTPTGNIIPEPAITVPVNVNRWGVANEGIEESKTVVYITGNTLYIQTPQSETITIYAINGSKLYEATVSSGTVTVDASAFPQGVLIVKGSSGWVKKIVRDS